jgi:hypothetical protein
MLRARYWIGSPTSQPFFHLGKIPNDTTRRKSETLWKFATAFHFVDGAVC